MSDIKDTTHFLRDFGDIHHGISNKYRKNTFDHFLKIHCLEKKF